MLRTLTIVTVLLAWPVLGGGPYETPAPSPGVLQCCVPDQFQTTKVHSYLSIRRGNYEFGEVVSDMAYDAVNQREAYITTRKDNMGPEEQISYFLMFQDNLMYVYNKDKDTCVKQALDTPFRKLCIPDNGEIVDDNFTYGYGGDAITASRVKFYYTRKAGNFLFVTISLTPQCIPIVEKFAIPPFGAGGLDQETVEYTNSTVGPVPDSVFELPDACCSAEFGQPEHYPSISFDY